MPRPWDIAEQVIVEPAVKLRFEFTSEHSRAVSAGEEPPYHDRALVLNVYNESGTRVIRMSFTRGGDFVGSEVEGMEDGAEPPLTEQEKIARMVKPAGWAETTKEEAWQGVNLAQRFASDIE